MRFLTQGYGDLSTYLNIFDEIEDDNNISTLKQIPINNHREGNRGLIKGDLPVVFFWIL